MIVDVHTHFYDPSRPAGVPWPPEDNELLYRTVLPGDFLEVAEPVGVTATVVVEASKIVEDNQWKLDLAESNPCIVGFVGSLDPATPEFSTNLDRFAANPIYRGIRLGLQRGTLERLDSLVPALKQLAEKDLQLDVMTNAQELPNNAKLLEEVPDLRVVIDHVAHVPVDGNDPDSEWFHGVQTIAKNPNVYCKVSGMVERAVEQPAPTDPGYYVPTLDSLWDAFGEDRLIYGSNWKVCERAATYGTVFNIVSEYFKEKGEQATEKFFSQNARAAYKWVDRG